MQRTYETASLPLCDLYYVRTGTGPPLIMVPATLSDMDHWLGLIAFMAQRFTVYFFDLPGHGRSTPLEPYSSRQVARVVVDLANHLGLERVNLMGFSFGGILTLTTLGLLSDRVDNVILISPLVDSDALAAPHLNKLGMRTLSSLAQRAGVQRAFLRSLQSEPGMRLWIECFVRVANVEHRDLLRDRLSDLCLATVQTLTRQSKEILGTHDFRSLAYPQPCYFAMSVRDPLLEFSLMSLNS